MAGLNGAGKSEIIRYLSARSFEPFSLSDVIRAELIARGREETRENLIELGTELRAKGGPSVLARRAIATLTADRNYAIDSIRHPDEAHALRSAGHFFKLVWVDAAIRVRFERITKRARTGDPPSFDEFKELEERELGSADLSAQQLLAVKAVADFEIDNSDGLESLHNQIQSVLEACSTLGPSC